MKLLRILIILLIFNVLIILGFIFSQITSQVILEKIEANVSRVIDGDTLDTSIGRIRILGINTPEKGYLGAEEATNYLKPLEGRKIELESKGYDKYGRILGYVYYDDMLVNLKILEHGLASLYYYDKDLHYDELMRAEQVARENQLGIWKKSVNYGCIELIKLNYIEKERCKNEEQLILKNNCKKINAVLKDDATHIFKIELNSGIYSQNFSCIWNDEGDSLYVWDSSGLLLFWRY